MSNDLISRSELKKTFENACIYGLPMNKLYGAILKMIDNAPTVEAYYTNDDILEAEKEGYKRGKEEKAQGEWIVFYTPKKKKVFKCDKCLAISIQGKTNFCPKCGADMRKGGAE